MHGRVYFVEKENQSGSWPSKVAITALKHRTQSACHERLQKPPPLQHIPSTRLICTVPGLSPQLVCQFLAPVLLPTTVSRASCHLLSCSGTQTHQSSASLWHFTTVVSHLCPSPARALPGSQPPALAKLPVPHPATHLRATALISCVFPSLHKKWMLDERFYTANRTEIQGYKCQISQHSTHKTESHITSSMNQGMGSQIS